MRNTNVDGSEGRLTLNSWRHPDREVRISVYTWRPLGEVSDQFIEHPRSLRLIWNYYRHIGIRATSGKLRSRISERARNRKVAAVGRGRIVESPDESEWSVGSEAVFFAPNHPEDPELVCVDVGLITRPSQIECTVRDVFSGEDVAKAEQDLLALAGWSPYSGVSIPSASVARALAVLDRSVIRRIDVPVEKEVPPIRVSTPNPPSRPDEKTAVLFGLGNYAKTAIIPNIRGALRLVRVHEIDPEQLRWLERGPEVGRDTAPVPRDDFRYDAWFLAGYHHTHGSLALSALRQGAYAVVEKPLATTRGQFAALMDHLNRSDEPSRIFGCFQKRYSKLHDYVHDDLGLDKGEPIDMHCIVYEIPLPDLHWYNWPASGSRLVSNGCHWIDYFMYVNGYAKPTRYEARRLRGTDIVVHLTLENGAYLVMSLTDTGSQRLGVREHLELRGGGLTVRIQDGSGYQCENRERVIRRARVNPLRAYARMYRTIAGKIARGEPGDDLDTLRSTEATLNLEEVLR